MSNQLAIITGSEGEFETRNSGDDIIKEIVELEGLSPILNPAICFEMLAIDNVTISINGRKPFTLKAGTELEKSKVLISSVVILTTGAKFSYYVELRP
jgi:hypothetical protein